MLWLLLFCGGRTTPPHCLSISIGEFLPHFTPYCSQIKAFIIIKSLKALERGRYQLSMLLCLLPLVIPKISLSLFCLGPTYPIHGTHVHAFTIYLPHGSSFPFLSLPCGPSLRPQILEPFVPPLSSAQSWQ